MNNRSNPPTLAIALFLIGMLCLAVACVFAIAALATSERLTLAMWGPALAFGAAMHLAAIAHSLLAILESLTRRPGGGDL